MLQRGMPPEHPGEVLKGLYLEPLEISITEAAARLGITVSIHPSPCMVS